MKLGTGLDVDHHTLRFIYEVGEGERERGSRIGEEREEGKEGKEGRGKGGSMLMRRECGVEYISVDRDIAR